MAVEIKHINGTVLYVAKHATDVRKAVEEAVAKRANLGGANLGDANLGDANLGDANLRGANLGDAYGFSWDAVTEILTAARQTINDSGRHWIKGSISRVLPDGSTGYCAIGAVEQQQDGTARAVALWLLGNVAGGDIASFNDHPDTTWEDVDRVFHVAVRHAERFAAAA